MLKRGSRLGPPPTSCGSRVERVGGVSLGNVPRKGGLLRKFATGKPVIPLVSVAETEGDIHQVSCGDRPLAPYILWLEELTAHPPYGKS